MTNEERARAWSAQVDEGYVSDMQASLAAEFAAVRREALLEAEAECDGVAQRYRERNIPGLADDASIRLQIGAQAAGECERRIRALAADPQEGEE